MTSRGTRVVRGSSAAVLATFVAAFSHVAAGGSLPSIAAIGLSLALSILGCIALAGRAISLWRTASSVALSQLMFHGLFSSLGSHGGTGMPAHAGHGGALLEVSGSAIPATGHASGWMWLAHGAAAVLTLLAIRYGEKALRSFGHTARLLFGLPTIGLAPVRLAPAIAQPPIDWSRSALPRDLRSLFSALPHRGPPSPRAA